MVTTPTYEKLTGSFATGGDFYPAADWFFPTGDVDVSHPAADYSALSANYFPEYLVFCSDAWSLLEYTSSQHLATP